ncbi:MAG: hypothetical protein ACTHMT_10830 [Verrucomicrobiota bacterium]|jgi:hypothetical protein
MDADQRGLKVTGVLCAALTIVGIWLGWQYAELRMRVTFADEQTRIFDEMRAEALRAKQVTNIAGSLRYTFNYYRSGSKQLEGSNLDQIVERHRVCAMRDIIDHLRTLTGEDLGESPEAWIKRYSPQ